MTGAKTRANPRHPNPEVVQDAEAVFAKMGITPEEAIRIFYKQTALRGAFPIEELIPNEETQEAARQSRSGVGVVRHSNADEIAAEFDNARTNC